MSTNASVPSNAPLRKDARIAIAAAKWNTALVDELMTGCVHRLKQLGMDESRMEIHRVPGAFELPIAAKMFVDSGRFDAVILLGCVIRGETYHFEVVANEAARGTQQVATASGVPCIFGVLTVDSEQQARERLGGSHGHAGIAAADAAADMIALADRLKRPTASGR